MSTTHKDPQPHTMLVSSDPIIEIAVPIAFPRVERARRLARARRAAERQLPEPAPDRAEPSPPDDGIEIVALADAAPAMAANAIAPAGDPQRAPEAAPRRRVHRRSARLRRRLLAALSMPLVIVLGCGAGDDLGEDDPSRGIIHDGSGGDGSGLDGTGADGEGATGTGAAGGTGAGGPGDGRLCSLDLQSVVDEHGVLVELCDPGEGCLDGQCLPACDAAAGHQSHMGCAFTVATPPFTGAGWPGAEGASLRGPCHAAFVANAWHRPAQLTLSYQGQLLDLTAVARIPTGSGPYPTLEPLPPSGLPPGEVAIVFLSHHPQANNGGIPLTCPVPPAIASDTAVPGSGRGDAFVLTSDTPVTAYAILPYGGARTFLPSATLLIPHSGWSTAYHATAPHDLSSNPITGGKLWLTLVGQQDGTTVHVRPPVTLPAGPGLDAAPAGQSTTVTLDAGETVQWLGAEPTGAVISSDRPIGVFSGSTYLWVTGGDSVDGGRDAAHQQLPPVAAMGHEYVGGGVVTRLASLADETVPYRLLGVVDGTQLDWDPAPPAGAPSALQAGQVVELSTTSRFRVRSQDDAHPFSLTQYMTGSLFAAYMRGDGTQPKPIGVPLQCGIGDEEWVRVLPSAQFLHRYVFFTDPTYATTNLVITRRNLGAGFREVSIDCLGIVSGWQPIGQDGEYEVAHVDLRRGMQPVGQCDGSRHEAWSDGPFGVTVWGTDWCASYAYPAGGSVKAVNSAFIP